MPTLETVRVYPGMGLIEGTSLSEGRGTTKPFEITGGPKMSPVKVLSYFKRNNVPIFLLRYLLTTTTCDKISLFQHFPSTQTRFAVEFRSTSRTTKITTQLKQPCTFFDHIWKVRL
jgi:hypothetical protein